MRAQPLPDPRRQRLDAGVGEQRIQILMIERRDHLLLDQSLQLSSVKQHLTRLELPLEHDRQLIVVSVRTRIIAIVVSKAVLCVEMKAFFEQTAARHASPV